MGEMRNAHKYLIVKPVGIRPLGRSGCRWEDNIIMELKETVWEGVEWMHLAQNRDQ
jgi:hypothetical protein